MPRFFWSTVESQIGTIYVASTVKGICKIAIPGETKKDFMTWLERHADKGPIVEDQQKHRKFADELNRYFGRKLVKFHVRLDLLGTPFQRRVWAQIAAIPSGQTRSISLASALAISSTDIPCASSSIRRTARPV